MSSPIKGSFYFMYPFFFLLGTSKLDLDNSFYVYLCLTFCV